MERITRALPFIATKSSSSGGPLYSPPHVLSSLVGNAQQCLGRLRRQDGAVSEICRRWCRRRTEIEGSRITGADQNLAESRVAWDDFNKRQEFEHELINRKTTWLLTTQAILFAAYGVSVDNQDNSASLREVTVWTGVSVAVLTWIGVGTVVISKLLSWRDYAAFYRGPSHSPPKPFKRQKLQWGVRTWNTPLTLLPDLLLPLVFILGWLLV
jgi:hypothetical protein